MSDKTQDIQKKKRCYARYNPDMTDMGWNPCGHSVTVDGIDYCPTNGKFDGCRMTCGFIKPWTEKDRENWLQYKETENERYK